MKAINKIDFNEFLSPEDIKRISEIELILELNEDNSVLFLIGVDDKELGEIFRNYFEEKLKNSFFYNDFDPKRVFTNLLDRDTKPYYLIDLYSKKYKEDNQKEVALDFLFNRDYIPEKGLKLILIVENSFLDFLMRKASDFVSFNNFLHHFKSYKLYLKESYSTLKLDKAIAEFKEFKKNNPNAENEIIIQKMGNIATIANNYGELKIAMEYLNKAFKKSKKNEFYKGIILLNLGNIYKTIDNLNKSLNSYEQALDIFTKLKHKSNMAYTLSNIGNIYLLTNDLDKAEIFYIKGMNIAKELNDKLSIAKSIGSLGRICLSKKELNQSLNYFKESLKVFEELNDRENISITYSFIAKVYEEKSYLEEALNYYIKSLKLSEKLGNKYTITIDLKDIADLYTKQNITHLAKTYYEKALTLAKQQNYTNFIKEIQDKLKELK